MHTHGHHTNHMHPLVDRSSDSTTCSLHDGSHHSIRASQTEKIPPRVLYSKDAWTSVADIDFCTLRMAVCKPWKLGKGWEILKSFEQQRGLHAHRKRTEFEMVVTMRRNRCNICVNNWNQPSCRVLALIDPQAFDTHGVTFRWIDASLQDRDNVFTQVFIDRQIHDATALVP